MSRKSKKHRVTLEEAIERVPHDEFYCLDSGRCPYFQLRHFTKGKMTKIAQKNHIWGVPVWYARTHTLEYCSFLREYLSIQDGCKDCGINCDFTQKQYNELINSYKVESDVYTEEDVQAVDGPYRRRIQNKEYADYLKEKFPDEAGLIDRIVEEDHLEYWYKDKRGKNNE